MTVDATEGRTYTITTLEIHPDIKSCKKPPTGTDRDYIVVETPYVVPNGMWVMERLYDSHGGLSGVSRDEVEVINLDTRRYSSKFLWVSSKPFGFTNTQYSWSDYNIIYRRRLDVARQIHKGELGQSIPTPHLDYVRQPFTAHQKMSVTKARERRRGQHGWVKLADLGEVAAGYNVDQQIELILKYWKFSGHVQYEDSDPVDNFVDIVLGSSLEIKSGDIEVLGTTREEFGEWAKMAWEDLWIRRGFAYTILRLQALGIESDVLQPA